MFLRLLLLTVLITAGWLPSVSYSQPIRISYSGVSGQNLPFWVTYEAGLYKKHGLNAEMVLISGGLTNIQALLANEIAFTYLGAASPIRGNFTGRRRGHFSHRLRSDALRPRRRQKYSLGRGT